MLKNLKLNLAKNLLIRKIFFIYMKFISYFISDELFVKISYFLKFRKWIDLKNPKTFNEKLQYLKLRLGTQEYANLVDKVKVREIIKEKIWEEILTKVYWVWKKAEEIPYDPLPDKFVIKCNHWSWYNIIVQDKSKIDKKEIEKKLNQWMSEDYYILKKETQYKFIDRKIYIEEFLENFNNEELKDFRFFCFNWNVTMIWVDININEKHKTKRNFYDLEWNKLDFGLQYPNFQDKLDKPKNFDKMLEISNILWKNTIASRIDFYEINWKIYFWEITFTHWWWTQIFFPNHEKIDLELWNKIKL